MSAERVKNPVFVLLIGLCPVAGVTDRLSSALAMAACSLLVLLLTSLAVSAARGLLRGGARRGATAAVAGLWVAVLDRLLGRFLPEVRGPLGIYLPLLAVSCLVLTHGSRFAAENPPGRALGRGLRLWAGFALALLLVALVREPLGHGTLSLPAPGGPAWSLRIPFLADHPLGLFAAPAGALLVLGYGAALFALRRPSREGTEETP